jgi:eukaryotic-like serine/threonine-protein kinase
MSMCCATVDAYPTVGAYQVAGSAGEPAGRLVAGRYRFRSHLGSGGMGRVWLADDEVLRRPVALKQVLPDGLDSAAWECAFGEARAAARVDHVGAVKIYDVVEENRRPWIVMEPLSGWTLREWLSAEGPLPVHEVARVGLSLLDVLQATHRAGVVPADTFVGSPGLRRAGMARQR